MPLQIVPISYREAAEFVRVHHRHHQAPQGCKFCIGLAAGADVVGVAIVGRPVSRMLQDGWTAEIVRLCVLDGVKNGCSMLLGASWRAARAMGYRRIITYTLQDEGGASLRGAGFTLIGQAGGGSWSRESRPRVDTHPLQQKIRWERNG